MGERMTEERLDVLRQRIPSCVDEAWKREVLAEVDRARASEDALRAALYVVSTDVAQDALEDPVGWRARRAQGWVRVHVAALDAVQAALAPPAAATVLCPSQAAALGPEGMEALQQVVQAVGRRIKQEGT